MTSFENKRTNALEKAAKKIEQLKKELAQAESALNHTPLAIVGVGCNFPGDSCTPEAFWDNLVKGYDGISEVPLDRWDAERYFSPEPDAPGKINSKKGGFLTSDVTLFDADFFGISPNEARSLDPQQRLILEVTWQALENAAINPLSLRGTSTGIYIGSSTNDYGHLYAKLMPDDEFNAYYSTGNSSSVTAGRVAYILGTHGPAMACDASCSSSSVALHLGCKALADGDTDLVIAGGVNLILSPQNSIVFSKANMLSEDGHCKTFDARADGYSRGEGCGVVIIKRLDDAIEANDRILCVIKGSAVNQNGHSSGLTAPNADAQEQVISQALKNSKLMPADIDFIETHGTGTAFGDAIEIEAIKRVFSNREYPLTIGAVKTNIGHLECASGIAGVIKVILSLQYEKIPKHINFKKINPLIDLEPFKGIIPLQNQEWKRSNNRIRRAGLSTFGLNGTNVHIVLEEAPERKNIAKTHHDSFLFCFSAKSAEALKKYLIDFMAFLDKPINKKLHPADVSYTLNTGRGQYKHRSVIIASSLLELRSYIKSNHFFFEKDLKEMTSVEAKIALEFLKGQQVNFDSLYTYPARKISLPYYAFQKKRYWLNNHTKLSPMTASEKVHPLLKVPSYNDRHQETSYTTPLNPLYLGFIQEHKIYGIPVISGGTYLSMLISFILQSLKNGSLSIYKLEFLQPLIVKESDYPLLQLIVNNETNDFEIISFKNRKIKNFTIHVKGKIKETDPISSAPIQIETLYQKLDKEIGEDRYYDFIEQSGLEVGPCFRWIKKIEYNDKELLASVRQSTMSEHDGYDLFPGIIDACFQVALDWQNHDVNTPNLRIPVTIDKIEFKCFLSNPRYVHMVKDGNTAHIQVLDDNGDILMKMSSMKTKELNRADLKRMQYFQHMNYAPGYAINWIKLAPEVFKNPGHDELNDKLLIISPKKQTYSKFKKNLHPLNVQVEQSLINTPNLKHILYIYPQTASFENLDDFFSLHQCVQQLSRMPTIKSVGIIINKTLAHSFVDGYWKTLRIESPTKRIYLMESNFENEVLLAAIIKAQCGNHSHENHIAIRNDEIFVPRLLEIDKFSRFSKVIPCPQHNQKLDFDPFIPDSFAWLDRGQEQEESDEVRISIKFSSIADNGGRKDTSTFSNIAEQTIFEHVGNITWVGEGVKDLNVGDRVLTFNKKELSPTLKLKVNQIFKIPNGVTFQQACSIPYVFLTAYNCLYENAKIKKGDTVLIHGVKDSMGLAFIQLATLKGAKIFVTADMVMKPYLNTLGIDDFYLSKTSGFIEKIKNDTEGEGVDILINALDTSESILKLADLIKIGGKFIAAHKQRYKEAKHNNLLRKDVSYIFFDFETQIISDQSKIAQQLAEIFELQVRGICQPLPHTVFDIRQVITAFQYLQSVNPIKKVLLKYNTGFQYKQNKTYLVTGGLGGLGRMLTIHLLTLGVKNIVLLGRSHIQKLPEWLTTLQSSQNNIQYISVDITDKKAMSSILNDIERSMAKLGGIFHLAGELADKPITNLTPSDFEVSFNAKVKGALVLHELTQSLELDCFVLFSSIASSFGSPGQANYAAANAFLDALAKQRQAKGLAAMSINWGPFGKQGMTQNHLVKLQALGLVSLSPADAFSAMDYLIAQPFPQAMIADFNWQRISALADNTTLLDLISSNADNEKSSFVALLKRTPKDNRTDVLTNELKKIVAASLSIDDEQIIHEHKEFIEFGIDSLMAVNMWNRLKGMVGNKYTLPRSLLIEYTSVAKLTEYFKENVFVELFDQPMKALKAISKQGISSSVSLNSKKIADICINKQAKFREVEKKPKHDGELSDVFLTGASGTLGGYITKLLLENTEINLHCLVRATNEAHAFQRLRDILEIYQTDDHILNSLESRVRIYCGDISCEYFSLSSEVYDHLINITDLTIHAAARLSLKDSFEQLYDTNVLGTKNIIKFSLETQDRSLIYISSYSIMGDIQISKNPPFKESDFDLGQGFKDLGYQKTKFESERIVREAERHGLKWRIIRSGDIFGDSKSGAYPLSAENNRSIFYDLFKTAIDTNIAANTGLYIDITPVDYVARGILHIIFNQKEPCVTFHLTNPDVKTFPEIIKILCDLGYPIKLVAPEEYLKLVYTHQLKHNGRIYKSLTTSMVKIYTSKAVPEHSTPVDATMTSQMLAQAGITCPKTDKALLSTLLQFCINEGYISSRESVMC